MRGDNLKKYREDKVRDNLKLVKDAIVHLKKNHLNITFSSVSRTITEIKSETQKGLTVAALSQNNLYKELILKEKQNLKTLPDVTLTSLPLKSMTQDNLIQEIYKLRALLLAKENENNILKNIMDNYNITNETTL